MGIMILVGWSYRCLFLEESTSTLLFPSRFAYFISATFLVVLLTKIFHVAFPKGYMISQGLDYSVRSHEFYLLMNDGTDDLIKVICCLSKGSVVGVSCVYHEIESSLTSSTTTISYGLLIPFTRLMRLPSWHLSWLESNLLVLYDQLDSFFYFLFFVYVGVGRFVICKMFHSQAWADLFT